MGASEHHARPLTSAVRLCVKGDGDLNDGTLALAIMAGEVRGWVMDELVVGSEALAERARVILSGVHEQTTGIPCPASVYVDGSIGPDGWFVRGGRA